MQDEAETHQLTPLELWWKKDVPQAKESRRLKGALRLLWTSSRAHTAINPGGLQIT